MQQRSPVIHWFRQDLRLADNPALSAAARSDQPVIPVYILDPAPGPGCGAGGAGRWWLHHSLARLAAALEALGAPLILRRGPTELVLAELVKATGANAIHYMRSHDPCGRAVEQAVRLRLGNDIELRSRPGYLLFEPEQIATREGRPFKVFTPFWKACRQQAEPPAPLPAPKALRGPDLAILSDTLDELALLPRRPDWTVGLAETWNPGEDGAQAALQQFTGSALGDYASGRDLPDRNGTSRLSPRLHFGEISPRQVWDAVRQANAGNPKSIVGGEAFLRQLGWREFSAHLLFHWPEIARQPLRREFRHMPWRNDERALRLWQKGLTGYPIVDAGMRELWQTGWMHNRVRMIAASFLVKDLLISWQTGEDWFRDTLVDADAANNLVSWQWVAGCGADAAPFFRIFNPTLQGRRFDPAGVYVRRWIPELAGIPDRLVHTPWQAPAEIMETAGIGTSYPLPCIDHGEARLRALAAYKALRAN